MDTKRVIIRPVQTDGAGASDESQAGTWWSQYSASLSDQRRLPAHAIAELQRVSRAVGMRLPDPASRPGAAVGAVVGAVQSGKTGVLGGMAAVALDRGYRIVVVLAGLKDDLRLQTARRLKRDLLCRGDRVYRWEKGYWKASDPPVYDHPMGKGNHGYMKGCWALHYKDDLNNDDAFESKLLAQARAGGTALLVVKKNARVLERLHGALAKVVEECKGDVPPMIILDDECDEASTGDADVARPTSDSIRTLLMPVGKQVVAYVGVTATIAANILQDPNDALFPRDFIELLRYPDSVEGTLTFEEPNPLRRYSGGYTFYEMLEEHGKPNFLVKEAISDAEQAGIPGNRHALEEALIAFFVAGAMRMALNQKALGTPQLLTHSMILHTESRIADHWALAGEVVQLIQRKAHAQDGESAPIEGLKPEQRIERTHLNAWLMAEEEQWKEWYVNFLESRAVLESIWPGIDRREPLDWDEVRAQFSAVFNQLKMRVINSDDSSSEPPLDFGGGGGGEAYDKVSIIIGGDRLSRGLTIDGLCISYFTRHAAGLIAEDTAVQRERWFGYRGEYLEYCRLFLHPMTAREYMRFFEHDYDLRRQFSWLLSKGKAPGESAFRLLCLPSSRPTAKAATGHSIRLNLSGSNVFVNRAQAGTSPNDLEAARQNEALASRWWHSVSQRGRERLSTNGELMGFVTGPLFVEEVIELLEGFVFTFHNPDPSRHVSVVLRETHRGAVSWLPPVSSLPPDSCPFLTAAYLRLWMRAFKNDGRLEGVQLRGPDGISSWDPKPPPEFNVGFRFGTVAVDGDGLFLGARLLNRTVYADGFVRGRWGGHGTFGGNFGDEWFDQAPPTLDRAEVRTVGCPGLVLLHVAHKAATGVTGDGVQYDYHRPFVGICVPEGGPTLHAVVTTAT